jgi:ParB family chromosome partitioning protein
MAKSRQILWLDPENLQTDSSYVRKKEGDLNGLASTIKEFGVLEPLGVRKLGETYRIVFGGRRRKAAIAAGVNQVPCVEVDQASEDDFLLHHLIENLQRRQLGDMEQAEGLAKLRRKVALRSPMATEAELDEQVGKMLGFSSRTVQRYLSLRELAAGVRDLIQDEELSVSQAQHLRTIPEPPRQLELAMLAVELELPASRVRDAALVMARRKNVSAEEAIHLAGTLKPEELSSGGTVEVREGLIRERVTSAEDNDDDLWENEPRDEIDDLIDSSPFGGEVATADGNRVRKIKTVDSFCDEVDRLSRAIEEGDLAKAAARNPEAAARLRLAYKQLKWTTDALEVFLADRGWNE